MARDPCYLDAHPELSVPVIADLKQVLGVLPFASFFVIWQCKTRTSNPRAVFPTLAKWRRQAASPYEKVVAGLITAGLALTWTAVVEVWHRQSDPIVLSDGLGAVLDLGTQKPMNNMSWVLYMIPSYVLFAFAECLVIIPSYDIFHSNMPSH
ncbi:hypothetical protein DYB37_011657 [Aphanomyces astaci]|uniref:Uncharacterized protein n=1 Tax=Aphanomyces astaci TaxID=112090 RepID=A0A3R6X6E6_APHAT|nr:hypothetical protein DYB35_011552 [Aphanomyces astaci]RHZ18365.1 hypothetical protein DYB37_011657 [Aphanomyces astaci]